MILPVEVVLWEGVHELCRRPYPRHPRGCPNYGRRVSCPPAAPFFLDVYDLAQPVYAIVTEFDLASHVARMKSAHPGWSDAQCQCCLYWQPRARKALRAEIQAFAHQYPRYQVTTTPEAMGVNVTATLKTAGIVLEWPPKGVTRQVALAGMSKVNTRGIHPRSVG